MQQRPWKVQCNSYPREVDDILVYVINILVFGFDATLPYLLFKPCWVFGARGDDCTDAG
ncbi:hypothetical protein P608_18155 [Comamonas thiooxydans]|uniref:Uncharacterized protein n=1 Tax=Comamonas thiooxydans TaxID=363952 RepID=A0A0E3BYI7_9BURK|nr:hypothetical protein P608_18155 [Comamonas thiooxydans]KGH20329.1 hypothetical protein P607_10225 [Comamonas thiooxydans]